MALTHLKGIYSAMNKLENRYKQFFEIALPSLELYYKIFILYIVILNIVQYVR